jgi:hypothetical protein
LKYTSIEIKLDSYIYKNDIYFATKSHKFVNDELKYYEREIPKDLILISSDGKINSTLWDIRTLEYVPHEIGVPTGSDINRIDLNHTENVLTYKDKWLHTLNLNCNNGVCDTDDMDGFDKNTLNTFETIGEKMFYRLLFIENYGNEKHTDTEYIDIPNEIRSKWTNVYFNINVFQTNLLQVTFNGYPRQSIFVHHFVDDNTIEPIWNNIYMYKYETTNEMYIMYVVDEEAKHDLTTLKVSWECIDLTNERYLYKQSDMLYLAQKDNTYKQVYIDKKTNLYGIQLSRDTLIGILHENASIINSNSNTIPVENIRNKNYNMLHTESWYTDNIFLLNGKYLALDPIFKDYYNHVGKVRNYVSLTEAEEAGNILAEYGKQILSEGFFSLLMSDGGVATFMLDSLACPQYHDFRTTVITNDMTCMKDKMEEHFGADKANDNPFFPQNKYFWNYASRPAEIVKFDQNKGHFTVNGGGEDLIFQIHMKKPFMFFLTGEKWHFGLFEVLYGGHGFTKDSKITLSNDLFTGNGYYIQDDKVAITLPVGKCVSTTGNSYPYIDLASNIDGSPTISYDNHMNVHCANPFGVEGNVLKYKITNMWNGESEIDQSHLKYTTLDEKPDNLDISKRSINNRLQSLAIKPNFGSSGLLFTDMLHLDDIPCKYPTNARDLFLTTPICEPEDLLTNTNSKQCKNSIFDEYFEEVEITKNVSTWYNMREKTACKDTINNFTTKHVGPYSKTQCMKKCESNFNCKGIAYDNINICILCSTNDIIYMEDIDIGSGHRKIGYTMFRTPTIEVKGYKYKYRIPKEIVETGRRMPKIYLKVVDSPTANFACETAVPLTYINNFAPQGVYSADNDVTNYDSSQNKKYIAPHFFKMKMDDNYKIEIHTFKTRWANPSVFSLR